jgi:hypothetical protein
MPRKRYNRPHWSKQQKKIKSPETTQPDDGCSRPPRETDGWKPTLEPGGILVEDPIVFPEKLRYDLSSDDIVAPNADYMLPYVLGLPHKPRRPTTLAEVMRNVVEAIKRETERRKKLEIDDKIIEEMLA